MVLLVVHSVFCGLTGTLFLDRHDAVEFVMNRILIQVCRSGELTV